MPLQQTSGNVTADAFGGGAALVPNYIESCFSTFLYDGGGVKTITNNIDLAGKGGLVWIKARTVANSHAFCDTARGNTKYLRSDTTGAESTYSDQLTSFNSNGFSLADSGSTYLTNAPGRTYASWTFRKQPKFFDVVTYTGNGSAAPTLIPHNLGSVPGFVLCKSTSATGDWAVFHRGNGSTMWTGMSLNSTSAGYSYTPLGSPPTATNIDVTGFFDSAFNYPNVNGVTYVAYLFAHNAGGFGLTGTDNVISCGSYTGNGSTQEINTGYEAQWVMIKRTDTTGDPWIMVDAMRGGLSLTTYAYLQANSSAAEVAGGGGSLVEAYAQGFRLTATGSAFNSSGGTYIYIAIRRGPMKIPTDGTKVFAPVKITATPTTTVTTNFPVDSVWNAEPNAIDSGFKYVFDRLRGGSTSQYNYLITNLTNAEAVGGTSGLGFDSNVSVVDKYWGTGQGATSPIIYWNFRRAPSFFDEVCYTGTGTDGRDITHNLAAIPELMIIKSRSNARGWAVYNVTVGPTKYLYLDSTATPVTSSLYWNNTAPTASVFTVRNAGDVNLLDATYVAYLFATCPGVSKVGSYTGTGTTQTINCGFTGGARFVLIKRTDATGNWMTFDTARGMTVLTDPFLSLNSTAAETATLGACTTVTTGFAVNEAILTGINTNGASYIFLSVA